MATKAQPTFASPDGSFNRKPSTFRSVISPDPDADFPAEKDRYVLYIHIGCPWAHRANIVRSLKGLEEIVQLVVFDASLIHQGSGWAMSGDKREPLYGFKTLRELYEKAQPDFEGRCTVPMLWDKKKETIVNNESSEVIRIFYNAFDALLPHPLRESSKGSESLLPAHLEPEIDALNAWVYTDLNNGVYRAGFATAQSAYDTAVRGVFTALDRLESHLAHGKDFLFGDFITDADVRLFPTIVRFDVAYHTIFKCNLKMVRHDYPRLHAWVKRLYWDEGERTNGGAFGRTVDFQAYKDGYTDAVRGAVVPIGPEVNILPL
ncbi:glutathione S-transferase [Phaeosphaeria sp. MPI-PUGE-AT-0046c]|nr:glutathione S-transferase [Phaeosphaeria sp. MPI-PUGE-AT-0046c]